MSAPPPHDFFFFVKFVVVTNVSVERANDSCLYLTGSKFPCHTLQHAIELVHDYNLGPVSISIDSTNIFRIG